MAYFHHYTPAGRGLRIYFSDGGDVCSQPYPLKMLVRQAIEATLDYEKITQDVEISVTFCGHEYIQKLNAEYRHKDTTTDVLSFPLYEKEEIGETEGMLSLGDIVLNLERAEEQAKEIGHSFAHEAAFLCIHSTLHLLGYDHELSAEDEEQMCQKQRDIVSTMAFPEDD